jgi:signal transduction histidine kinase
MPLIAKGNVIGFLALRGRISVKDELLILRALTSFMAVAFDNIAAYEKLQKAQQKLVLQERMGSIGTLTAGVAHEINNPINFSHAGAQTLQMAIHRFGIFLLELTESNPAHEIRRSINERIESLMDRTRLIVVETARLRDIVKDLRNFSRLDEAPVKVIDLAENLQSTINLGRVHLQDSIDICFQPHANLRLQCRPAQLNQVLMNLFINAIQAIQRRQASESNPRRGRLEIRVRSHEQGIEIDFEDNGTGIPEEAIQRIFEPFFTLHAEGGTGLGLSMTRDIVERHDGRISVRSTAGIGSCFTIWLPLQSNGVCGAGQSGERHGVF